MLSGDLAADGGEIMLDGRDIAPFRVDQRARAGLARSYQKTTIFRDLSALENVCLAAQAHGPSPLQLCGDSDSDTLVNQVAYQALVETGLDARVHLLAKNLSHGEQRQLEIAMVLATNPRVILLDEPLAGMGRPEALRWSN